MREDGEMLEAITKQGLP